MNFRTFALVGAVAGVASLGLSQASAVPIDFDDASQPAYADGWLDGTDGSTNPDGLGSWVFGGNAPGNTVIASSVGNGGGGDGDGDIDSDGVAFGLLDSGDFVDVFRFIDPADLQVGQALVMDIDVNFRGGFKGVRVRGADDDTSNPIFRFEIGNPGTGDDYIVYDALTGNGSVGNAYAADTQFRLELTQTTADAGTWTLTRSGSITDSDSGTYAGVVSSFQLYSVGSNSATEGNAEQAIYFNNFAIVPEPAAGAGLGLLGLAVRRRHR
ncbi:MAG: PEP-CTERM sorting domain-containing protein [Phycisphaerae bacterium]